MKFDKRLDRLEKITPDREYPTYGELLKLEATPGTKERKEFLKLYDEQRYDKSE